MRYILILAISFLALTGNAQAKEDMKRKDKNKNQEKIEAKKIGFITEKLELTAEEAQRFWPVYNEYTAKRKAIKENSLHPQKGKDFTFTEAEADALLNAMIDREEKELQLKKEYINKLKSVISKEKVAKLMIVERKFREKVMGEIRKRVRRKREARRLC